jgi:riboflavin biosynthesis pyrimidine reductase
MIDTFCAASLNNMVYYPLDKNIFSKFSSSELNKFKEEVREYYENIIVGANTIIKDNPSLLNNKKTNKRFIIDKYANLDINSNIFNIKPQNTYVFILKNDEEYISKLRKKKVNVIECTKNDVLIKLKEHLKGNTIIEGGSRTINYFLKNKFIDNIGLIIFPFLLPKNGKPLFFNTDNYYLELLEQMEIDKQYIFIKYRVIKK